MLEFRRGLRVILQRGNARSGVVLDVDRLFALLNEGPLCWSRWGRDGGVGKKIRGVCGAMTAVDPKKRRAGTCAKTRQKRWIQKK